MRIQYSCDVDALYIRLRETDIANTHEIADDFIVDYESEGNVIGIELLSASTRMDVGQLIIREFDTVTVERPVYA